MKDKKLLGVMTIPMTIDDQTMLKFQKIFEIIFVQTGQIHHRSCRIVLFEEIRIVNEMFVTEEREIIENESKHEC